MLAFLAPVLAAPTFVADSPELTALATHAWRHAVACAGREAVADEIVTIEVGAVAGGFAGKARVEGPWTRTWRLSDGTVTRTEAVEGRGLHHIQLAEGKWKPATLAHEVAHAWSYRGPPALVEGATTLLEACISSRDPARFPAEPARTDSLATLVDLREWRNEDDDIVSRNAGYTASARMSAAVADAVRERDLWRSEWTWEAFDAVLVGAGRTGTLLRSSLAGGVATQRVMLGDIDGDGILGLRERLDGTDPGKWDTDGDGWWDGAPEDVRARGVRLPSGHKPVCSGWAAGPLGAIVVGRGGRGAGEDGAPAVLLDGARAKDQTMPIQVPPGASIGLSMRWEGEGWGLVDGVGLVKDARCWTRHEWTVFVAPGDEAALVPFVAALQRADTRVDAVLGAAEHRSYVWLGEPVPRILAMRPTRVPDGWIERAEVEGWDYVAAYVVAKERLPGSPLLALAPGDTALFEAYARRLVRDPPGVFIAALEDADVAAWTARAAACPGGWSGLVRGECGRPGPDGEWSMDAASTAGQTPAPTEPP